MYEKNVICWKFQSVSNPVNIIILIIGIMSSSHSYHHASLCDRCSRSFSAIFHPLLLQRFIKSCLPVRIIDVLKVRYCVSVPWSILKSLKQHNRRHIDPPNRFPLSIDTSNLHVDGDREVVGNPTGRKLMLQVFRGNGKNVVGLSVSIQASVYHWFGAKLFTLGYTHDVINDPLYDTNIERIRGLKRQ